MIVKNSEKGTLSAIEENILKFNNSKLSKIMKVGVEVIGIPVVNMMLSELVGGIERRKLLEFQQIWNENNLDVELDENNKSQVELVEHAILKSIRCSKEGQIRKIIAILKGSFEGNIISVNDAEDLINIVSELSENEAKCLVEVYNVFGKMPEPTKVNEEKGIKDYGRGTIHGVSENQRVFLLNRLAGKGLVREKTGASFGYAGGTFLSTAMGETLFNSIDSIILK